MRVFVYWNLNKDCYSVRALEGANKGKVIAHAATIALADVTLSVGNAGRLQVLNGGHKQVHAGLRGNLIALDSSPAVNGMRAITYNPHRHTSFVARDTNQPLTHAALVIGLTTSDNRADCYATI